MTPPDQHLGSIGIFDSGFGGLTVMRAIRALMPHENIIYFGDTARLPYGSKSAETILRYSLENASFLVTQGIKVLVIACNTACSAALEQVRKNVEVPVIGIIEQGVEEVSRLCPAGRVAILGTRATITSGIYQQYIAARCSSLELFPISCPLLVPLVEEGYAEHPMSEIVVQEYLRPLKNRGIHGVLLGCTHYPLLQTIIQQELGPDVMLIDPAIACAEQTRSLLADKALLNPSTHLPHYQFFVSDDPEKFRLLGKTFLNYPIEHVSQKC
jgi:glutamate racemase